ncbi:MAG: hypothetical protein ABI556_12070 [Gemmatimonadales bacterium]
MAGRRKVSDHSRGVFRIYESAIDDISWPWWRGAPGFSQRFTGTLADGNSTIAGLSQLSRDNVHWDDDPKITYRRKRWQSWTPVTRSDA